MMHQPSAQALGNVLRKYFQAKDENRPHLLDEVFAPDAILQITNKTDTIAFPSVTNGCQAIADVLVRRFGQIYENIYSFYMSRPSEFLTEFSCDWLVGMTEKENKDVRVGCGRYDWTFREEAPHLAKRLVITIEAMRVLPPNQLQPIIAWIQRLNYPWTSITDVIKSAPEIALLEPVIKYLGRNDNVVRYPDGH